MDGGGVYAFFNTHVTIERSTIEGNTAGNVGGGMRSLGNVTVTNSTLSGNTSIAWHGGAIFHTDGVLSCALHGDGQRVAAAGPAAVFVGTFTAGGATLRLANSIVGRQLRAGCFVGSFGSGRCCWPPAATTSPATARATSPPPATSRRPIHCSDRWPTMAVPRRRMRCCAGSPAIDAAGAAVCPAVDQRGVARPQGPACDAGAFERTP